MSISLGKLLSSLNFKDENPLSGLTHGNVRWVMGAGTTHIITDLDSTLKFTPFGGIISFFLVALKAIVNLFNRAQPEPTNTREASVANDVSRKVLGIPADKSQAALKNAERALNKATETKNKAFRTESKIEACNLLDEAINLAEHGKSIAKKITNPNNRKNIEDLANDMIQEFTQYKIELKAPVLLDEAAKIFQLVNKTLDQADEYWQRNSIHLAKELTDAALDALQNAIDFAEQAKTIAKELTDIEKRESIENSANALIGQLNIDKIELEKNKALRKRILETFEQADEFLRLAKETKEKEQALSYLETAEEFAEHVKAIAKGINESSGKKYIDAMANEIIIECSEIRNKLKTIQ